MKSTPLVLVFVLSGTVAQAQPFDSGSTGADGALVVNSSTTLQVPPSGVFHFTTVTIASGTTLSFVPNQRNTPVIVLAQGDVVMNGNARISVDAAGIAAGPGGFYGGAERQAGFGPGGGAPDVAGQWIGPLSMVPVIGGSGGGGQSNGSWVGGGGGGAIVIASSASIQCSGNILARGWGGYGVAGGGSGGAIRLVANSFSGNCALNATGGQNFGSCCSGFAGGSTTNAGIIRIEAPTITYTGTALPSAVTTLALNPQIIPTSTTASLSVASIGGFPVLSDAGTRPGTVDVVLPRALTDPIALVVQGRNIPIGTAVSLNLSGSSGVTYTPGVLDGSVDQSLATLQVSGLDRTAETHLFVFSTFDVPLAAAASNPAGPDQVAKVRIEASPGKPSSLTFLRRDGSEIDLKKVPAALLQYFGYRDN